MPSISEKLKNLGVKIGARDLPSPPPARAFGIEQVVPGRVHATPYGEAYVVETVYTPDYRHGRAGLSLTTSLTNVADWAHDPRLSGCAAEGLLFLDTETTGLAGGTGTYAFLTGIGRFEGENFRVSQIFMRDPAEEPAVLAALTDLLHSPVSLVTFNGKAFDIPLLDARYTTNRFKTPFQGLAHLDLLPLARRLWRDRLASRALSSLEFHILGAQRTEEDVPGWLIPQIYFDYLRNGDARPLKRVLYHNAMDVIAMAALLNHVALMLNDPLTFAIEHGLDVIAIGKLFESLGRIEDAIHLYQSGLECEVPEPTFRETVQRLAQVHRRRGEWAEAVELWRAAARTRQVYAFVELAKYYEHQARDYVLAAQWTRDALAVVTTPTAPQYLRTEWQSNLEHRLERLERKAVSSKQ